MTTLIIRATNGASANPGVLRRHLVFMIALSLLLVSVATSRAAAQDAHCALDTDMAVREAFATPGGADAEDRSLPLATSEHWQQLARDIFAQLIEINTTHSIGDNTRAAEAIAKRFLDAGFAAEDVEVLVPAPRKGNLVVRYRGVNPECAPLLLLAHLDVVEVDAAAWEHDPFTLTEEQGYFYGRGVSDDKDSAALHIANLLRLSAEGYRPRRDIVLALTADEEGGTHNGVQWLLAEHPAKLRAAHVLSEGAGGVLVGGERLANEIQATEKMSQTFEITVTGAGGHSSMPSGDNVLHRAGQVLVALQDLDFPVELNRVTHQFFSRSRAITDGELHEAISGLLLDPPDPAAVAFLSGIPFYNASMRTVCSPTMITGGHAVNALPQRAVITVNCRLVPTDTRERVQERIAAVLPDSVDLTALQASMTVPGISLQPEVFAVMERVTEKVWPGVATMPIMGPGGTDGRLLRERGVPVYGTNGIFIDVEDDRAHAANERIRVRSFYEGLEFLYRLTRALAQ
ncbi:MAG: M20/M25/M40 family metallo-hydrolase [Haliea sp.]|uniref:M20/M25/M40 family metallo-hydrolase n=1 Tax=Haliea sp. TaxID=1932666 RepID=UPI0032ED5BCF